MLFKVSSTVTLSAYKIVVVVALQTQATQLFAVTGLFIFLHITFNEVTATMAPQVEAQ